MASNKRLSDLLEPVAWADVRDGDEGIVPWVNGVRVFGRIQAAPVGEPWMFHSDVWGTRVLSNDIDHFLRVTPAWQEARDRLVLRRDVARRLAPPGAVPLRDSISNDARLPPWSEETWAALRHLMTLIERDESGSHE